MPHGRLRVKMSFLLFEDVVNGTVKVYTES